MFLTEDFANNFARLRGSIIIRPAVSGDRPKGRLGQDGGVDPSGPGLSEYGGYLSQRRAAGGNIINNAENAAVRSGCRVDAVDAADVLDAIG